MPPIPPLPIRPRFQARIQAQGERAIECDKSTLPTGTAPVAAVCRGSAAARYRMYLVCFLAMVAVVTLTGCASKPERIWADQVVVWKSKRKMALIRDGKVMHEYRIALGERPWGHKRQEGDERTPEGDYILDWRNPNSRFYKSIHISYPNPRDIRFARAMGRDPGGMIMIHGQPDHARSPRFRERYLSRDWTNGCIAVRNPEMDEIWRLVRYGTPIRILP